MRQALFHIYKSIIMKIGIIGAGNIGEVIVLSIPFAKDPDLATLFDDVPNDVAVIDTSNSYPFAMVRFRRSIAASLKGSGSVSKSVVGQQSLERRAGGDIARALISGP